MKEISFVYQGKRGFLLSETLDCGIISSTNFGICGDKTLGKGENANETKNHTMR